MSKILVFNSLGGPEVLEFQNFNLDRELEPDEVLYNVNAFALNRSDWLLSAGYHYTIPDLPSRIGSEASGIVEKIGSNVKNFKVGDQVTSIPFFTQNGINMEVVACVTFILSKGFPKCQSASSTSKRSRREPSFGLSIME